MLIDTHAHINSNAFDNDRNEVIERILVENIWLINVGVNYQTSKEVIEIAENYQKGVFAAIGLHPINVDTGLVKIKEGQDEKTGSILEKEFDFEKYKEIGKTSCVKAIGEIGLDYYWKPKTKKKLELFKQKQKKVLLRQLNLATELNLPVIFHCRMAHQDLIELFLSQPELRPTEAVVHSFTGNSEQLQKYLEFGFYIGFNGIIFKSIEGISFDENIKNTPLDKILIETDCPYLTPPSVESSRNEPLFVKYIARRIAGIKKTSFEEVAKITTENAKKLFNI